MEDATTQYTAKKWSS